MSITQAKQAMQEQSDAPMVYLVPPRLKQMLLDGVPGCALSMGNDGNVVFTEPGGGKTSLLTCYRDSETKDRFIKEWQKHKAGICNPVEVTKV